MARIVRQTASVKVRVLPRQKAALDKISIKRCVPIHVVVGDCIEAYVASRKRGAA